MRVLLAAVALLFLVFTLSTCGPSQADTEADSVAVQATADEWTAAWNAGDVAGLLVHYADDAVRMPPNGPTYSGKAAIEEAFTSFFEQFSGELDWPTDEIIVAGDWAFHRGTFTADLTPLGEGEVMHVGGEVLVIFQRQPDGSWKAAREIWTDDEAPGTE